MKTEKVGQRIRTYMQRKEISLEALSQQTGLETGFLSTIIEDDVYPSLGPLLKIARALGVRLGTFLDDQVSRDPLIVRLQDREEELTMQKASDKPPALHFHSLGKGKSDRHMEPFFIEMLPEPNEDKKLSFHEGEEFIVVISGEVEIVYGKETTVLGPGDSIYFNSVVPHSVAASGEAKAEIYAVLYFPE